jgi:hypothetical protein
MTEKLARRFVMIGTVIIRITHCYLGSEGAETSSLAIERPDNGDLQCERQS